ncbi:DUF3891 family protein [Geomicrobium sediminis]|uniref:DUF3891 family protein n=1 Tax=Geomicrobium sediminis TaxID=1347788 RepID=A0ABS2PDI3_9BACL|nr:DUF3891 family protein [Geomicrobium sediminis]MBM7633483.1 hypothetical protein [Geomicrobium sediminis]
MFTGQLARCWGDDIRLKRSCFTAVVTACFEHDRGWQVEDHVPRFNESEAMPYDFTSFPDSLKIPLYEKGITEAALMNKRAGYLISQHLSSFYEAPTDDLATKFKQQEEKRRRELWLSLDNQDDLRYDLSVLRLLDEISLYVALNEPGVNKEDEWPWFKRGFSQTFSFLDDQTIEANWKDHQSVTLHPFPFRTTVTVPHNYRTVKKTNDSPDDFLKAFQTSSLQTLWVTFKPVT